MTKNIIQPLAVTYSKQKVTIPMTNTVKNQENGDDLTYDWSIDVYECKRYASMVYEYVGLWEDEVQAVAQGEVSKYLRSYTKARLYPAVAGKAQISNMSAGTKLMATVNAYRIGGCMWGVRVVVNEQDTRMSDTDANNIATKFYTENARSYG